MGCRPRPHPRSKSGKGALEASRSKLKGTGRGFDKFETVPKSAGQGQGELLPLCGPRMARKHYARRMLPGFLSRPNRRQANTLKERAKATQ
jgi:hypothetical protein